MIIFLSSSSSSSSSFLLVIITCFLLVIHVASTQSVTNSTSSSINSPSGSTRCSGHWRFPTGCRGQSCQYLCQWKYNYDRDQLDFTLSTNRPDKWVGVGFSKDLKMPGSDVIIAWVEPGSRYVMMDAWLDSYSLPIPDAKQSISNISAAAANGLISFFFSRPFATNDAANDVNLDSDCVHFIFPVGGGSVDVKSRLVMKHDVTPTVTSSKFCFQSCHARAAVNGTTKPPTTTSTPVPTTPTPMTSTTTRPVTTTTSPTTTSQPTTASSHEIVSSTPSPTNDLDSAIISDCKGEWKYPARCTGYGCDYKATWEYLDDDDDILFTLATKHRNKWTGIAFSNDRSMPQTDAIIGLVEDSGRFFLMDTWLRSYAAPSLDPVQNIQNMTVKRENGITSLRFTRKRKTGDKNDYQFSDTNCPYFIFPVNGGVFNAVNKRLRKHESVPIVSEARICVKSCRATKSTTRVTSTVAATTTTTSTTPTTSSTSSTTTTTSRPPPAHPTRSPSTTSTTTTTAKSEVVSKFNDFDFSQLGPSVVDLSKFRLPDGVSPNNMSAINSLLESVSNSNLSTILKNLARLNPKNETSLVSLLNPLTPLTGSGNRESDSYPSSTISPTSSSSSSLSTPSSIMSSTSKPSRVTPTQSKIPSRWSTFRTTTSTTTTTTTTTSATPKKDDEVDTSGDDESDGPDEEDEVETPSPDLNVVTGNGNDKSVGKKRPLLVQESKYLVELKIPKAWRTSFVRRQSEDYIRFKEKIETQMKKELASTFTNLDVKVMELHPSSPEKDEDATIAKIKLSLMTMTDDGSSSSSSSNHPKGKTQEVRESSSSSSSSSSVGKQEPVRLEEALNLAIKDGRVGDVFVDSTYLVVKSLDDQSHPSDGKGPTTHQGTYLTDDQLKWTAIIGGVAALIMLVMVQASCMVWRDKKNRSTNLNKDKVIPISRDWPNTHHHHHHHPHQHHPRDSSYENFGMTLDDGPDGPSLLPSPGNRKSAEHHLKSNNHYKRNGYEDRSMPPLPPPPNEGATRHPRGATTTSSRHPQSHHLHHLQPDFYFMPHQRRYSGEVMSSPNHHHHSHHPHHHQHKGRNPYHL